MSASTRPAPADFAEQQHLTLDQLRKHYGAATRTIKRWREEAGLPDQKRRGGTFTPPPPTDYAVVGPTLPREALCGRYNASHHMIACWDKAIGFDRRAAYEAKRKMAAAPRRAVIRRPNRFQTAAVDRPHVDLSTAGRAADFLRRFGPVVRCNRDGSYNPRGSHWRRNTTVLTADEVIARAQRIGFDADEWKRVA